MASRAHVPLSEQNHAGETKATANVPYSYDSVIASRMRFSSNRTSAPRQTSEDIR